MTAQQSKEADRLARELADLASTERAMYRRQVLAQSARLFRELLDSDEDEPCAGCTDGD